MGHMRHKRESQTLTQESAAQLRQLDRAAFVICGSIWSRPGNCYNHCRAHTATGDSRGKYFPRSAPPRLHQPPIGSQPIPQGESLEDSPLPNSPIRDTVITERDAQLLGNLHRLSDGHSAKHCIALRHSVGREPWDILWRHWLRILLAGVPKGPDRLHHGRSATQ